MDNKRNFGIIVLIILLVALMAGAFFAFNNSDENEVTDEVVSDQAIEEKNDLVADDTQDEIIEEKVDEVVDDVSDDTSQTAGKYVKYNDADLTDGTNILFFHAGWCPTCGILDEDIEENVANIPSGTTIYRVNYDDELELRRKYDVTVQHTIVHVDSDGNKINSWVNSLSLNDLIERT